MYALPEKENMKVIEIAVIERRPKEARLDDDDEDDDGRECGPSSRKRVKYTRGKRVPFAVSGSAGSKEH